MAKLLKGLAFVLLLLAVGSGSFFSSLYLLEYREQAPAWPNEITATRLTPQSQLSEVALLAQPRGSKVYWSMSVFEPVQISIPEQQGLVIRFRATSKSNPTTVASSPASAWLLPLGQYLFEAAASGTAAPLNVKVVPWRSPVNEPQPIDAAMVEGFNFVNTLIDSFDAQADLLRGTAKQRPDLIAVGKILTQQLVETRAFLPSLEPATKRVGTSQPGVGAFTANDTNWIWLQATGLAPLPCQLFIARARAQARPKALAYMYVNAHDSSRDILPLKEENVDPVRLCNEPLNKVTTGLKWL